MTITIPISKAREELPTLVNNAKHKLTEYVITVNGAPAAVILSASEYESWKETNEILADKELMESIKRGEEDIKYNRLHDWEDVKKELFLNDKNVSYKINHRGKKRSKKT